MKTAENNLEEWTKLFPRQASEDCISSGTFIKQLTRIIISSITYLKDAFPQDSYAVEYFSGVKIPILKNKCRDGDAQFLITSLLNAFEAFDKRYLHQLALYFYENECRVEEIIESHVFEYTYKGDMASVNVSSRSRGTVPTKHSFQNIYEQTAHILKTYIVFMTSSQRPLPLTYSLSVRLNYNEDAPEQYHAPGFQCADEDVGYLDHNALIKVRSVVTNFHRLQLFSYFKGDRNKAIIAQNSQQLTNECEETGDLSGMGDRIACPCKKKNNGKRSELLTCHYCKARQHAACFGILSAEVAHVSRHCCAACHDADSSRSPTDQRLVGLAHKARVSLSMFRRTLEWCMGSATIDTPTLGAGLLVSRAEAAKLLKMLELRGVIYTEKDTDLNKPQKINTDKLNSAIDKYFNRKEENMVGRLLAEIETSISQEDFCLSDPIGKVLDQDQRLDIQNTSNIGRVINKPVNKPVAEDKTLKQYRDALVYDEVQEPIFTSPVEKKTNKRRQKTPARASVGKKRAKV